MAGNAPHIPGCRDLSLIGERVARSLFSAVSDRIGRPVTVTVFPPLSEGRTSDGFDRAAATAQRLGAHPSVLTIHEWGHASDGRPWIVTDPQPPESVDTLLTMDGPLEVERALQVGVLLAGALETAHRSGIVHGDLSPARLVFGGQGEPLVAETGLAPFAVFPGLGALNNPVRYFSPPEVLERTDIGPSTDVYSLATTVYALLAGRAPQQKPAEVTDSNASLLLRILQMPVPPIDRPDLPVGLEDALRAPLSPNPDRRPQQAIDVAWLLQDVQRRAGFAVTEPVVLDLDDVAGGQQGRDRSLVAPAFAPSIESAAHAATSRFSAAGVETAPAAPQVPADDNPGPAPWAPEAPDAWGTSEPEPSRSDPWSPAAPTALGASGPPFGAPPEAFPEVFPDEDVPPPTIFPFAEGSDRSTTSAFAEEALPASSTPPLWPGPDQVDQPADSLWPSSWPATDEPVDELPAWATPPANGSAEPAPDHAVGDDGGSIGDLAELSPPRGPDGPGAAPGPPAFERPAELDELPSWYTDPLPNAGLDGANGTSGRSPAGPPPSGNGHGRPPESRAFDAPSADAPLGGTSWPFDTSSIDDPRPADAPGPFDRPDQPGGFATPARPAEDEVLPGSGHELRSLFGEVVGGEAEDATLPARRPAEDRPAPPGVGSRPDPTSDPLGPPQDRPPIDLTQLDAPLGPSPYLPSRDRSTGADTDREPPPRLPRRHEVASWQPPTGQQAEPATTPRLPRATEQRFAPEAGADDHQPAPRLERAPISQVAPAGDRTPGPAARAAGGPPAMPVIVLICVVLVLAAGAAWLVITGDDAGTPATERPAADGTATNAPTGLQAFEGPDGAQVSWSGTAGASFVVTVLSTDRPPQALPPTESTSALVPAIAGQTGGRCFTVALADTEGTPGTPSEAVCTGGGTIEAMQAP